MNQLKETGKTLLIVAVLSTALSALISPAFAANPNSLKEREVRALEEIARQLKIRNRKDCR